jgi:hypothetical protein
VMLVLATGSLSRNCTVKCLMFYEAILMYNSHPKVHILISL